MVTDRDDGVSEAECSLYSACAYSTLSSACYMQETQGYVYSGNPVDTGRGYTVNLQRAGGRKGTKQKAVSIYGNSRNLWYKGGVAVYIRLLINATNEEFLPWGVLTPCISNCVQWPPICNLVKDNYKITIT